MALFRVENLTLILVAIGVVAFVTPSADLETHSGQFYSGYVTELGPDYISVNRINSTLVRGFEITPETKIKGQLVPKARVTVEFARGNHKSVATRIIVRAAARRSSIRPTVATKSHLPDGFCAFWPSLPC